MKYKWLWIVILLAIAALLVFKWWKGEPGPGPVKVYATTVSFDSTCVASVAVIDAYTDGTVTFSNQSACAIKLVFSPSNGTQPFDEPSITLPPGESATLTVRHDANGTYSIDKDCASCDPGGGSSTPVIKVSPPPPPNPDPEP